MRSIWLSLLVVLFTASWASAQQDVKKLTARELFYSGANAPAPAPHKPSKPAAKAKPAARTSAPAAAQTRVPDAPPAGEPLPVIHATYSPQGQHAALGLRYTILQKSGDAQTEVSNETLFRAGDRIRLAVEANDESYLYVVNRGSSGTWKLLFPSPEVKDGDNRIHKRIRYEIPSGYTFTFDEQAGEEKLFIVLTRKPEPDLDGLIYSLGQAGAPKPAAERPKLLLASAAFTDDVVSKLRAAYARDLIVEKVDDEQPGAKNEKAVYAVNPTGSADSRVVADVTLKHR